MKKSLTRSLTTSLPLTMLLLGTLIAAGCTTPRYGGIIDWIDFVNMDDTIYQGVSNGVLRDPDSVTDEVVGVVKKTLDGNVNDSSYRSRSGDAAFLKKGTKLYRVDGFAPEYLVAVRDEERIGGYQIYAREKYEGLPDENFKSVLQAKPTSVMIYRWGDTQPMRTVTGSEITTLTELLRQAVYKPNDPSHSSQEPTYHEIVFDTGEPILYRFALEDDGETVRFQWEYQVDDRIRELLKP